MYFHNLQKAPSGLDIDKSTAQAILSLSFQNNKIPNWTPPTICNPYIPQEPVSDHQEMNDGFRDRRRTREESSEDAQQHFQDGNALGNRFDSDSPHSRTRLLLAEPIGQIDDYDGDMDGSSSSKRAKRYDQQSGGQTASIPASSAVEPSTAPQEASLTQPSLPNSPFVFFFRIEREDLLEKAKHGVTQFQNTQQVVEAIEKKWESMPMEDRRIYEQLAAKDEERYKREMEEYQLIKQQPIQEYQQRLLNQADRVTAHNLQNMLFPGVSAGTVATPASAHVDPRMHQVNVIAGLRPPFTTVAVAAPATTAVNATSNVAPSHHHFMLPTQPTSLSVSSHAMYPNHNPITPPQNAVAGVGGQQLPPHLPLHQHLPGSPASPAQTATGSGTIILPPSQSLTTTNSGTIVLPPSQSMPFPAGMEVELGGRKYKVGYQYQLMSREEAQKYVKPYTAAQNESSPGKLNEGSTPPPSA